MALVGFEVTNIRQEYLSYRHFGQQTQISVPDGFPMMEYRVHVRDTILTGETMMTRDEMDEYNAFCGRVRGRVLSELGIVQPEAS